MKAETLTCINCGVEISIDNCFGDCPKNELHGHKTNIPRGTEGR